MPFFWVNYFRTDGGRTSRLNLNPELDLKISSRFTTSLSFDYTRNRNDSQWFDNFTDSTTGVTHYTFAHLEQKTLGVTWRLDYTFSRTASLQIYAQPFVSKGTYSNVRELGSPRAARYDDRYQAYARHLGHQQSGRVQLSAVPIQCRVSLGVPPRLHPVPGLESGAGERGIN